MEVTDLSKKFEQISIRAKTANDELKAAGDTTRDKLETDVARARDKATAAADQSKAQGDTARDDASSHWQAIRDSWHAHVAKARTRAETAADNFDARQAALNADWAEDYACNAITFALNVIDEAESATLTAIYARANAATPRV